MNCDEFYSIKNFTVGVGDFRYLEIPGNFIFLVKLM